MKTPVLELRGVHRTHGSGATEIRALRGVSLMVSPGELVGVMGPSGSGKSTLLNLAGGLDAPTSGEVYVEGAHLGGMSRKQLAALRRRSVGYVFQDLNLLPSLTAVENVALPLELDGIECAPGATRGAGGAGRGRPDRAGRPVPASWSRTRPATPPGRTG